MVRLNFVERRHFLRRSNYVYPMNWQVFKVAHTYRGYITGKAVNLHDAPQVNFPDGKVKIGKELLQMDMEFSNLLKAWNSKKIPHHVMPNYK